jgi:hypothetical protein
MKYGFFLLLFWAFSAQAIEVPRYMSYGSSSFTTHAIGNTCYAFDIGADVLPCNPAYMAKERKKIFKANGFFGNSVSYAQQVVDLLKGDADQGTVQKLFGQKESSELEANAEAGFLMETFALSYSPARLNYYTLFRNQSLPEMTVFASKEDATKIQIASYIENNFYLGLQLRYVHRQFIANSFFLTDALAENGKDLFQPKEQNLLYVEPSILYSLEDVKYQPEFSFSMVNFGFYDKKYDEYPSSPQFHLSGSAKIDVSYGKLGLGGDFFWDQSVTSTLEPFTLGGYYQFGVLKLLANIAENSNGLGFQVIYENFNLGLTYSYRQLKDELGDSYSYRRVYMQLGIEI